MDPAPRSRPARFFKGLQASLGPRRGVFLGGLLLLGALALGSAADPPPPVVFLPFDETMAEIFEADPPSALDAAIFLLNLKKHAPRGCAVAGLWHWPQADHTSLKLLSKEMEGLPMYLGALLENDSLESSPLPEGTFPQLPSMDGETIPTFSNAAVLPSAALQAQASTGFLHIDLGEDAEVGDTGIRVPLLARGPEGQVLPSLALAVAVGSLGMEWSELQMIPGEALRMGETPHAIPIDSQGALNVPFSAGTEVTRVPAHTLISTATDGSVTVNPAIEGALVIVGDDRPDTRQFMLPSGQALSRAELLAWTVQTLLWHQPEPPATEATEATHEEEEEEAVPDVETPTEAEEAGPPPIPTSEKAAPKSNLPQLSPIVFIVILAGGLPLALLLAFLLRPKPTDPETSATAAEPPEADSKATPPSSTSKAASPPDKARKRRHKRRRRSENGAEGSNPD